MLITLISGVALGCVYALVALGYSLIFRTTGIVNFAQGAFVMVGGMSTWWLLDSIGAPFWLSVVGGVVVTGVVGALLWGAVVLPLWKRGSASFVVILATLVFAGLAEDVVEKALGTNPETLPSWVTGRLVAGSVVIDYQYLVVIGVTLLVLALVLLLLKFSVIGRAMRAVAADRKVASLLGISAERVGALAMVATAAIGGLAGVLFAPVQYTAYSVGLDYGIFGFVAAVIGGFGSLPGALVGGLVVGVVESLVGRYLSATYEEVIALVLLLVLLVVRPRGLVGSAWAGEDGG